MSKPTDEVLDHDYDGIREYDNPLPKWWVYMFYGTIAFALVYVPYYHFGLGGQLPREQWASSMSEWYELHPPPKLATAAELEQLAADPEFVRGGEAIYKVRCIACHAIDGGGTVGPNLTDDFSIYGYERDKIVSVIYNGTPKGMLAWKDQLSLDEIYKVGSYVRTLRGTTPASPKAPEGEKIVDQPEPVAQAEPAAPEKAG
ncbi:MAG: c-type cytochrome [Deltaproteobacteria bacterium]|nr:c-type cytochrome [Deltaproteobacteria bacterium]